jgi:hypothetical protein
MLPKTIEQVKLFVTTVSGVGPFCIEFADGEIVTTRTEDRQRLIAAAPELLEALKDVVNYFWNPNCNPPILNEGDVQSLVEAAIARAEGRDAA